MDLFYISKKMEKKKGRYGEKLVEGNEGVGGLEEKRTKRMKRDETRKEEKR